ncbi:nucleotidyl transferase AbiEii/AbiGii toxin family protein [Longispora sp. NPDC051575]|uniref:nucleotidyl transferase AbiEii/AbiGii toxin family protein n=1 Tax=Longispora sp. NPDC051575 TaxID=3154943 RepID=UPI00343F6129
MVDFTGDFEIHLTVGAHQAPELEAFAVRHGLKFSQIVLAHGQYPSQPMVTVTGNGPLERQHLTAQRWQRELDAAKLRVSRVKIEVPPWNEGVPQTDEDVRSRPGAEYFEHHVKILLPDAGVDRLLALTALSAPHGAQPSRNARRRRPDGREERFVTQRCRGVGRGTAQARLEALLDALRSAGHEVLEVEREYVVHDSAERLDSGWLDAGGTTDSDTTSTGYSWRTAREDRMRSAPAGRPDFPATYLPLPHSPDIRQRAAFDPALKQFANAYRAGEPEFADPDTGEAWRAARRSAMEHVLGIVAGSRWADHLVLRGSILMRTWFGEAAREPGDLDFVVIPHTVPATGPAADELLDGLVEAVRHSPGPGLRADAVAATDIWTYERASGRRLVFPFVVPGLPRGGVQLDFVFEELLPIPPEPALVRPLRDPVLGATAELSLAWKLLWLATDMYPQGKDLYDAVLLAEHTTVSLDLVRELLTPELGETTAADFRPESVLAWEVDWGNFRDEYPGADGTAEGWLRRLALALSRVPGPAGG